MATREQIMGIPNKVTKGGGETKGRHRTLFDYGMKLRGINMPTRDLILDMEQFGKQSCIPPLSKYDIDRTIITVLKMEFKNEPE